MVYYVSDKETKSLAFRELFHGFSSFNALMHNVEKSIWNIYGGMIFTSLNKTPKFVANSETDFRKWKRPQLDIQEL